MAIYYEPDEISAETYSQDQRVKVTRQGDSTPEDHGADLVDSHRRNVKQIEPPKQRCARVEVHSRAQLIESIKRGESPTWVPNPALEALVAKYNPVDHEDQRRSPREGGSLPSGQVPEDVQISLKQEMTSTSLERGPEEIERPRSALHTGDFFEKRSSHPITQPPSSTPPPSTSSPKALIASSPTTPWYAPSVPFFSRHSTDSDSHSWSRAINARSRAPSLGSSLSSSFAFRPPTSPLVYAASNTDLDFPVSPSATRQSSSPDRGNRRRTLPPESFHSFQTAANGSGAATNFSRPFLPFRREASLPYQAHQPRRSLTSISTNHSASSPQTPLLPRSRRPSFSSDHSPIHHASMVGSFEESILRGRMSTAPSKPLDFVAQIGVLGRGDCKTNLRCPAHVTVPFPAVFYNYPSVGNRSFSDDSPSPYVGTIDLEHSLKPLEAKKIRRRPASPTLSVETLMKDVTAPENTHIGLAIDRKKRERHSRRSSSPKGPLGGCYRVPQHGQLQIVIKNPNKTAVKLYLVPYSLEGMESGTKTFVRQRSFSAGPILEKPLTDNPQAILPDRLQHKSILRYLIHLKFCCPTKGKYYLYDNIRVVFANRVPDGKETLRNEVQLPEPRYSCYRPGRESSMGSAGAKLAAEKASRRRSSGFGLASAGFEAMDGLDFTGLANTLPVGTVAPPASAAIPFHLSPRSNAQDRTVPQPASEGRSNNDAPMGVVPLGLSSRPVADATAIDLEMPASRERTASPKPGFVASTSTRASPIPFAGFGLGAHGFSGSQPLSRTLSPPPAECGEGLLARELRSIDAQKGADRHT
jgi:Domain of unknown function (DUF4210)/Chromosome segregation during meiosis